MYSEDIPKICGFCALASKMDEDTVHCNKKACTRQITDEVCRHYRYDILKRQVRRKKAFKTDLKPEDFEL